MQCKLCRKDSHYLFNNLCEKCFDKQFPKKLKTPIAELPINKKKK